MDITPLIKKGQQIIQSYAGGCFKVSGVLYSHAIIVTPSSTTNWGYVKSKRSVSDLVENDFQELISVASEIDVVLLGCGSKMRFLDPSLKKSLRDKGLSVDIMDTGAACRTYNVLMVEGRRVAAALFPV